MSNMIYKRAETTEELQQILQLQRINIPEALSEEEKAKEGFVTVHHHFDILKAMNDKCQHIIALDNNTVIGYALCMVKDFKEDIEVLRSMFAQIESRLDVKTSYVIMGQICIAKTYRKKGIFRSLYHFMKQELAPTFDCIVTEVDESNTRSMNAHLAIGFKTLKNYYSQPHHWALLSWRIK